MLQEWSWVYGVIYAMVTGGASLVLGSLRCTTRLLWIVGQGQSLECLHSIKAIKVLSLMGLRSNTCEQNYDLLHQKFWERSIISRLLKEGLIKRFRGRHVIIRVPHLGDYIVNCSMKCNLPFAGISMMSDCSGLFFSDGTWTIWIKALLATM